jgi:hypothetical protein
VPLLQVSPAGQGDDRATFLAEFRALRDRAALEYEELAAKAHYPADVLKDAEDGPGLPGLPILAAYVRACGGDVAEWEERWRRLASSAGNDSGLPVRPAGASPAAVAGARAGVTVAPAEVHDTERIKAALRAHREREEQTQTVRNGKPWPSEPAADLGTTAPEPPAALANGSHPPASEARAVTSEPAGPTAKQAPAAAASGPREHRAPRASRNKFPSDRPGLLALVVVLVLVGCVAALAFT